MSNNRVIHFEIQADDVERAQKFYEKAFGWEINQMMKAEEGADRVAGNLKEYF